MRIIAGKWRGRPLVTPKDRAVRPTTDRIREALFSKLNSMNALAGAHVLDCFAGTGALGFEALSRDAVSLTLVEKAPTSLKLITENKTTLGADATIIRQDATKLGPCPAHQPFNLIFLDPPYGKDMVLPCLDALIAGKWVAANAVIVIETDKRETLTLPAALNEIDARTYGDTRLTFAEMAS